ncbi:hypothetical protein [Rhodosalinus sp. 5P4]|uniref:hypothetical protein n=1 Tax=Rhodosalinus sp. 5P4 TaxID=3239196 RepID=UPI00352436FC
MSTETRSLDSAIGEALRAHPCPDSWAELGAALTSRLEPDEHAALAWAALRSLPEDVAVSVVGIALPAAGPPLPPWSDPREDADFWARLASRDERRAYATAAFRTLEPGDRRAFAKWAGRAAR